jgi:Fur family zinc uptake transcriptional regulator
MLTNARLAFQDHDHVRSINAAIKQAQQKCTDANVSLNSTREAILRLLWHSNRPLGAYQLQQQLAKVADKPIAPPTIYRALEFLQDLRLVHKIPSLNAFIGCPFPNSEHSNIFLICEKCNIVAEVSDRKTNQLLQEICQKANFKLNSQIIELFGICPNCEEKNKQK